MIGATLEKKVRVTDLNTAIAAGSGDCPVFATPMMIAEMEGVSAELAKEYIEAVQTTVGTKISVSHISATPIDMEITVRTELVAATDKTFEFKVSAYDAAGLIGEGTHTRAIVHRERFIDRANKKVSL